MQAWKLVGTALLPAALVAACAPDADPPHPLSPEGPAALAGAGGPHVVHVAPPTRIVEQDRASILAALAEVRPGGTVQFAPGTYVIGVEESLPSTQRDQFILVTQPRITLQGYQGHPGTTIRGCELEAVQIANCMGFELSGGHQTVRGLAFENFFRALNLGRFPRPDPVENRVGGYLIEHNSFRDITVPIALFGHWQQPARVRHNTFANSALAVQVWGRTAHVTDNHVSAPDPERVPIEGYPRIGLDALPWNEPTWGLAGPCEHNVFARNRVEGVLYGIVIEVGEPGGECRNNVVRDNTVLDMRVFALAPFEPAAAIALANFGGVEGFVENTWS